MVEISEEIVGCNPSIDGFLLLRDDLDVEVSEEETVVVMNVLPKNPQNFPLSTEAERAA